MKHPTTQDLTYNERVLPAKKAAVTESLKRFADKIKSSRDKINGSVQLGIESINDLRDAGLEWQRASERDQLDLGFYLSIETMVQPQDREFITRDTVKVALHFANPQVLSGPITSAIEAAPHLQKVLWAHSVVKPQHRQIEESHPPINLFADWAKKFKGAAALLADIERSEPIDQWPRYMVETYVREAAPENERYQKAVKFLADK